VYWKNSRVALSEKDYKELGERNGDFGDGRQVF
jgi:hypothetical protein